VEIQGIERDFSENKDKFIFRNYQAGKAEMETFLHYKFNIYQAFHKRIKSTAIK